MDQIPVAADDGNVSRLVFGARDSQAHSRHLSVPAGCLSFAHQRCDLAARAEKRNSYLAPNKQTIPTVLPTDPWRGCRPGDWAGRMGCRKVPEANLSKAIGDHLRQPLDRFPQLADGLP